MKMKLYLTLVHSQLMYCTPIWCPYLQKHIQNIERIQRRVTKFILNDYDSNYKTQLLTLELLPLMYLLELQDIIFTVKSLKYPTKGFNILHSVHPLHVHHPFVGLNIFLLLIPIIDTHSSTDCLEFGMPSLLLIYIYLSPPSKSNSKNTFRIILYQSLIMKIHVLFIYDVLVTSAIIFLLL